VLLYNGDVNRYNPVNFETKYHPRTQICGVP